MLLYFLVSKFTYYILLIYRELSLDIMQVSCYVDGTLISWLLSFMAKYLLHW